jgi:hypothetical protein
MEQWHVQFSRINVDHVEMHPTPEAAIESACLLMDQGCDVYGIGTGALTDSIERNQISRIYELWARARYPFGKGTTLRRQACLSGTSPMVRH